MSEQRGIVGRMWGATIVQRMEGEDVGDEELRWDAARRWYVAGPTAWRVFMQLHELKLEAKP